MGLKLLNDCGDLINFSPLQPGVGQWLSRMESKIECSRKAVNETAPKATSVSRGSAFRLESVNIAKKGDAN